MKFILDRKIKYYTKEALKYFKLILVALVLIVIIILMRYRPIYGVSLAGEEIGFVENRREFEESVLNSIENMNNRNIDTIAHHEEPKFQFKLVSRAQDTNESEVKIALQRNLDITYRFYEIVMREEVIERVDAREDAEAIIMAMKENEAISEEIQLEIVEQTTQDETELNTNTVDIAKQSVLERLTEATAEEEVLAELHGVRFSVLPVSTGRISARFGARGRMWRGTHTGLDISAPTGTDIRAVADGTVISARWEGSYGNMVKIDHGNGIETWYAHASRMFVRAGQHITAGDVIAAVGSTGNSTGPHLHFEVRINGEPVNPQRFLYN